MTRRDAWCFRIPVSALARMAGSCNVLPPRVQEPAMRASAITSAIGAPHGPFCRVGGSPRVDGLGQFRRSRLSQQPVEHLELIPEKAVEGGTVLHRVTAAEPPEPVGRFADA